MCLEVIALLTWSRLPQPPIRRERLPRRRGGPVSPPSGLSGIRRVSLAGGSRATRMPPIQPMAEYSHAFATRQLARWRGVKTWRSVPLDLADGVMFLTLTGLHLGVGPAKLLVGSWAAEKEFRAEVRLGLGGFPH